MEKDLTKTCKTCFQTIDERAIKCPYCHSKQTKLSEFFSRPAVVVMMGVLPIAAVMLFGTIFTSMMFDTGEAFELHRDEVKIVDSEMKFGANDCGATVVLMGKIKNKGKLSWENLHFEAKFLDKNKQMIDTEQQNKYSFHLEAGKEAPFKISFKRSFPKDEYDSYEVRVLSAKEAGKPF